MPSTRLRDALLAGGLLAGALGVPTAAVATEAEALLWLGAALPLLLPRLVPDRPPPRAAVRQLQQAGFAVGHGPGLARTLVHRSRPIVLWSSPDSRRRGATTVEYHGLPLAEHTRLQRHPDGRLESRHAVHDLRTRLLHRIAPSLPHTRVELDGRCVRLDLESAHDAVSVVQRAADLAHLVEHHWITLWTGILSGAGLCSPHLSQGPCGSLIATASPAPSRRVQVAFGRYVGRDASWTGRTEARIAVLHAEVDPLICKPHPIRPWDGLHERTLHTTMVGPCTRPIGPEVARAWRQLDQWVA